MKKLIALALVALLMLGLVPMASAEQFENKELNIAVFEGGFGRAYWDEIIAQFEAAYPGVKVNMNIDPEIGNILAPQVAVGEWPDFISLSDTERSGVVASMIKNQDLLELTELYDTESLDHPGVALKDMIVAGMLDSTKYAPYGDGKVFLAPFNVGPMGMVYNKKLFADKGWKVPVTWDEFFALGQELEKEENYVEIEGQKIKRALFTYQGIYAGYLESIFYPAIANIGGLEALQKIATYQEGSFDNDVVRQVLNNFVKIGADGLLMEGTVALNHTQSQTDMMLGKALFMPNGTWMEGEMAEAPREEGFEFGLCAAPALTADADQYVLSSYEQFEIPKEAKNPELAKEFLKFLYTDASVLSFAKNANGTIARTDATEVAKDALSSGVQGMFGAYEKGKFMLMNFESLPADCKVNVGATVFDENMGPLFTGTLSVDDYIQIVEDAFAQIREDIAAQA